MTYPHEGVPHPLPVDPAAVQADDAMLDALHLAGVVGSEDQLVVMFAAWRDEVESEPAVRIHDADLVFATEMRAFFLPRERKRALTCITSPVLAVTAMVGVQVFLRALGRVQRGR